MSPPATGRPLLITATVLIAATVIAVIMLTPSPAEHRRMQRDNAVLTDLEQLEQAIQHWQDEHRRLPADLAVLADQPGLALALAPADGGPAYTYQRQDAGRYRLCAHFLTDTADGRYGYRPSADRTHGAGRHCFARHVRLDSGN